MSAADERMISELAQRVIELESAMVEDIFARHRPVDNGRESIPERMLSRLISCWQSTPSGPQTESVSKAHHRFISTSALIARSAAPVAEPVAKAEPFSLTSLACSGDGICGPVLCLPEQTSFDPMCDVDNPWHEPLPDVALDSQRLWLRGLYWSFALYILACCGLLVAHSIVFGIQASIVAASSLDSKRQNCHDIYFVSVGNLAGLALAPGILILTRFIIFVRDMIQSAHCHCHRQTRRCYRFLCAPCCRSESTRTAIASSVVQQTIVTPHSSLKVSVQVGDALAEKASTVSSLVGVVSTEADARTAAVQHSRSSSDGTLFDSDDEDEQEASLDENGEPRRQSACDQAVMWSGNLLLIVAILDVVFFTVWNFISPVFLDSNCDDVVPESFYNLQLITSIFLWLFCGELLLLWVSVQIISCCTQRHGLCLSVEQRGRLDAKRRSERVDRDLAADAERRRGVRRLIILGPHGSGKRHFVQQICRGIHAGRFPGLHLLQFAALKQQGGTDVGESSLISLPPSLVDCLQGPAAALWSLLPGRSRTVSSPSGPTVLKPSTDTLSALSPIDENAPIPDHALSINVIDSIAGPASAASTARVDWLWFSQVGPDIQASIMEFAGPVTLSAALRVCRAWFSRLQPMTSRFFSVWMHSMLQLRDVDSSSAALDLRLSIDSDVARSSSRRGPLSASASPSRQLTHSKVTAATLANRTSARQALMLWDRKFHSIQRDASAVHVIRVYDTIMRCEVQLVLADSQEAHNDQAIQPEHIDIEHHFDSDQALSVDEALAMQSVLASLPPRPPRFRPSQRISRRLLESLSCADGDVTGLMFMAALDQRDSVESTLQSLSEDVMRTQALGCHGRATPRIVCLNNAVSIRSSSHSSTQSTSNSAIDACQNSLVHQFSSVIVAVNDQALPDFEDAREMFAVTWRQMFPAHAQRWM